MRTFEVIPFFFFFLINEFNIISLRGMNPMGCVISRYTAGTGHYPHTDMLFQWGGGGKSTARILTNKTRKHTISFMGFEVHFINQHTFVTEYRQISPIHFLSYNPFTISIPPYRLFSLMFCSVHSLLSAHACPDFSDLKGAPYQH